MICRNDVFKGKSKDKLKSDIRLEITSMFETTLDFAEVACTNEQVFKSLRSKILRVGNNCIRSLHKSIDDYYEIVFVPNNDNIDVINIKNCN